MERPAGGRQGDGAIALHVLHAAQPASMGGVETYALRLLPALEEVGWESAICLPTATVEDLTPIRARHGDVPTVRVPVARSPKGLSGAMRSFASPAARRAAHQALVSVRPALVHVHHLMFHDWRFPALAKSLGIPVFMTLHDFWLACHRITLRDAWGGQCGGSPDGTRCSACLASGRRLPALRRILWQPLLALRQRCYRRALMAADAVIAPSRFTAPLLLEALGVKGRSTHVLGYPVPDGIGGDRARVEGRGRRRAGFIGSIRSHKGLDTVADASASLSPEVASFEVYGDASLDEGYVDRLVRSSGGWMRFHGRFEPGRLAEVLQTLDILVVPSLWRETGPQVALEALSAGLIVVGSRLGGLVELAEDHPGRVVLFEASDVQGLIRAVREAMRSPVPAEPARLPTLREHTTSLVELYGETVARRGRGGKGMPWCPAP